MFYLSIDQLGFENIIPDVLYQFYVMHLATNEISTHLLEVLCTFLSRGLKYLSIQLFESPSISTFPIVLKNVSPCNLAATSLAILKYLFNRKDKTKILFSLQFVSTSFISEIGRRL